MTYSAPKELRVPEGATGTLPLLAYLAIACLLMVADHRGQYAARWRQQAQVLAEPIWWLGAAPGKLFHAVSDNVSLRSTLVGENNRLRRDLDVNTARLNRLAAVAEENRRLRELLGGTRGYRLGVQLAGIVDIDLDPARRRIVLDQGSRDGVRVGQALIDAGGVLGQVIETSPHRATALLITDPDHAVPVQVARSGLRSIAYGTGRNDVLVLPNIPHSADIQVGDQLITSGLGGRFPAGFPVGTVLALRPDETRLFVVADAAPAAHLDRGSEVLLVSNAESAIDVGPPVPAGTPNNPPLKPAPAAATLAPPKKVGP